MFDKSQLQAYSSIKAPDELYDKVIASKPKKSKIYLLPLAVSFAACLMLIFGSVFYWGSYNPQVTFNGQNLTDSVVFYAVSPAKALDMRSSPVLSVPVELKLDEETEVSVNEGVLMLENGEKVKYNTFKGNVSLIWEIEQAENFPKAVMTLKSNKVTKEIVLTQNETDGSYTAKIN